MLQNTTAEYLEILTKDCAAPLEADADFIVANGNAIPKIFNNKPVATYKQWTIDTLLQNNMAEYVPGTEFEDGDLELEDIAYTCQPYGQKMKVVDRNRVANELETKGKALMTQSYRNLDQRLATVLSSGANFGHTYAGVASGTPTSAQFLRWDVNGSTPIEDIEKYKTEIASQTGLEPRHMIISKDVFNKLKANAEIKATMRTDADKIVTPEVLARFFDMDAVYVMKSVVNTAKRGATPAKGFILEKTVLIYHRGMDDELAPACLKAFFNTEYGNQTNGAILEGYRDENLKSDIVRSIQDFVIKVTMKDLGTLLTDVIS